MLHVTLLSLIAASTFAHTSSGSDAPFAVTCQTCRLIQLVAQESPPPLVDAPPSTVKPPAAGAVSTVPPLPSKDLSDPHAGSVVGKEIVAGGITLLGSDVVAVGVTALVVVGFSIVLPLGPLGFALGAGLLLVHNLLLSPLYCALAVKGIATEPTQNGLLGAALGAYSASLATSVIMLGAIVLASMIAGPGVSIFAPAGAGLVEDIILFTLGAALRYVGIPLATSFAMHLGKKRPAGVASFVDPRPYRWVARATMDGREVVPLQAPILFSW